MGEMFRVHPEAIGRYASTNTDQFHELDRIRTAISGISISPTAFGHLPNAQNLAQAYQEHAEASRQNLSDLAETLTHTANGLTVTAQNYGEHDRAISQGLGGVGL